MTTTKRSALARSSRIACLTAAQKRRRTEVTVILNLAALMPIGRHNRTQT